MVNGNLDTQRTRIIQKRERDTIFRPKNVPKNNFIDIDELIPVLVFFMTIFK